MSTPNAMPAVIQYDAWHGTTRRFTVFDPDRSETEFGCFFSDTPEAALPYADKEGGRVLHARLTFENPFRCTADEWHAGTAPDPREIVKEGLHDGYVIDGLDGVTFITFEPASVTVIPDEIAYGSDLFMEMRGKAIDAGYLEEDEGALAPR